MKATRVGVALICLVCVGAAATQPAQETPEAAVAVDAASTDVQSGPMIGEASPAVDGVSVLRLIRFNGTARGAQGQALAGTVGITFALYREQEGGAPLWLETQNVSLDPQGRYTALLGATSNEGLPLEVFTSGEARWLGIQVQGQPEQRVLLVSVPYALKAAEAETLAGKTASDFILTEQLSTQVEEEISTQIEQQGLLTSEEAGTLAQVSGSGTVGRLAKFTSPTAVGNSIITEKNGNIGIGFNNPIQKLVVAAGFGGGLALNFTNLVNQDLQVAVSAIDATDKFALFGPSTPTNLALAVGGQEKMRITNAGDVGIGTSTPAAKLDVTGGVIASGLSFGVDAVASQPGGIGVEGEATNASGGTGVKGRSLSTNGVGVLGLADAGFANGVKGTTASNSGVGVLGDATALDGNTVGVSGLSDSSSGTGVFGGSPFLGVRGVSGSTFPPPNVPVGVQGTASASDGIGVDGVGGTAGAGVRGQGEIGVHGTTSSATGVGVKGEHDATSGAVIGVLGQITSFTSNDGSAGVKGEANHTSGQIFGVRGTTLSAGGAGVSGEGPNLGVEGEATAGTGSTFGVKGTTTSTNVGAAGVLGEATGSGSAAGVRGTCSHTSCFGVEGKATASTGATRGVVGSVSSTSGIGVVGEATGSGGFGVFGSATNSSAIAAVFQNSAGGNANVIVARQSFADDEFRVEADGDVFADGTFTPGGADFAESVEVLGANDGYEPGDVLIVDASGDRRFALSEEPYSPYVAGIYSTKPGLLGRQWEMDDAPLAEEIPMAIVGIVPCKVSAENGAIERGDLLVTAATPGHAMKGTDRERMLGAVVGKALGSLQSGAGVIEVLVTLQ